MPYRKSFFIFLMLLVLLGSACGRGNDPTQSQDSLQGTITISGAWALYPMMITWGEQFQKVYPEVQFDISAGGAGKGMSDVLAGAVDIGMVSREIYPEETEMGAFWIAVTKDAVFLTVNAENPVWSDLHRTGLTREKLMGVFFSGDITTWGQLVDRSDVNEPIHVFTRSDAAGAPATWAEYLGKKQEDLIGIGVYGDPGILDAVIKDPLGIGYNNLNYAYDFDTRLPVAGAMVVPLDINSNGIADPQEIYDTKDQAINAVATNQYPSPPARDLNLVTKGLPSPLVKAFISWILTDGQAYVDEAGYIALPAEKLVTELKKLD